jgi:hypothetical protein
VQGLLHDPSHLRNPERLDQTWDPGPCKKCLTFWTQRVAGEKDEAVPQMGGVRRQCVV